MTVRTPRSAHRGANVALPVHPVASLLPPMSADAFRDLCNDVRAHGLREAIWLYHGQVIDGVHRYRACQVVGVEPRTRRWEGSPEALIPFVISMNLHRRHLSDSQRALVAARLANLRDGVTKGAAQICAPVSQSDAAALLRVSRRSVQTARAVLESGTPELVTAVAAGTIAVSAAAAITELPPEAQLAALTPGETHAVLALAKRIRTARAEERKAERLARLAARTRVETAGRVQIFHEAEAVLRTRVADQSVDLLFTDPIYTTHVKDIEAFSAWVHPWLAKVKPTGRALIFTGAYNPEHAAYLKHFSDPASAHAVRGFTLDTPVIWAYENTIGPAPTHTFKLNYQLIWHLYGPEAPPLDCPLLIEQCSVQQVPAPDGRGDLRLHAWEKPARLLERLILFTTAPGALVVDPYCGTGAHLAAAAKLGRMGLGGDIDAGMVTRCRERGLEVIEGHTVAPTIGDLPPVRQRDQGEDCGA